MSSQSSFEQSNNNVVAFPGPRAKSIMVIDDSETVEESDRGYVNDVVEEYARTVSDELCEMGFDVTTEAFNKHFSFTMESFRSTLLLAMGISHPFQQIIEEAVETIIKPEDTEEPS